MVELLVLGTLLVVGVTVFAVLASVFGAACWLLFLPFRILGWVIKGFALVLALPFVAIFGVIAFVAAGGAMLMFLAPLLPFALIALGAWWLVRRKVRPAASVTG